MLDAPPAPKLSESRKQPASRLRWLPVGLFIGVPLLLILAALRPGEFLFGHDVVQTFYYLYGAVGKGLAGGRLPVWGSETMCGAPTLASLQSAPLYPLTWPAAVLSPGAFWTFSAIVHLSLAGFFANGWLRRGMGLGFWGALAGGMVFMLSGFVVTHLYAGHLSFVASVPWAAALLWRLERILSSPSARRAALLGGSLTMMIFCGFPQAVMIAGVALGLRLVHFIFQQKDERRERLKRALLASGALLGGTLLAAPQLLPTLELLGQTQRAAIASGGYVDSYSLGPENLLTLLAPTLFGDARVDAAGVPYWGRWYLWEMTGFVGISALFASALGLGSGHPQRRFWGGVSILALLLSLGSHTPVLTAFVHLMPGASLFRVPSRFLYLFTIALLPLLAMGFDRLMLAEPIPRKQWVFLGGAALLLLLGGAALRMSLVSSPERWESFQQGMAVRAKPERDEDLPEGAEFRRASRELADRTLGWAAFSLLGVVGSMALHRWSRRGASWSAAALGTLMAVELLAFDRNYLRGHSEEGMTWPKGFAEAVRSSPAYPCRIATINQVQTSMIGMCQLANLDHLGGYDPMMLARYTELLNVARGLRPDEMSVVVHASQPGPLFDLLGARYWILPVEERLPPGWRSLGKVAGNYLVENPRALPRAFLVSRSTVLPARDERLGFLSSPQFDPSSVVVLETGSSALPEGPAGAVGTVRLQSRGTASYDWEVESSGPSILVLTESYYPGWSVEVDGKPSELLRADHLFQGVRLAPGLHRVRFSYRSTWLVPGFSISFLALLSFAAVFLGSRKRVQGPAPVPG